MKKNTWIWVSVGVVGVALFFAYKKPSVPQPDPNAPTPGDGGGSNISKRKELKNMDMQFAAMNGKSYIKPTNLIPSIYDRFRNANGGECRETLATENIMNACKCSSNRTITPGFASNFK